MYGFIGDQTRESANFYACPLPTYAQHAESVNKTPQRTQ